MQARHRLWVLILLTTTATLLSGCMSENEKFIQGSWYYFDEHLGSIVGESELIIQWGFGNGVFTYDACCFNIDETVTGRYEVFESTENTITLRLFNTRGSSILNYDNVKLPITIDRQNDTISPYGGDSFIRSTP